MYSVRMVHLRTGIRLRTERQCLLCIDLGSRHLIPRQNFPFFTMGTRADKYIPYCTANGCLMDDDEEKNACD